MLCKEDGDLRLSSVYLYEKIKKRYKILKKGNLSGTDGYLRPFLYLEKKIVQKKHIYIIQGEHIADLVQRASDTKETFWIISRKSGTDKPQIAEKLPDTLVYVEIVLEGTEEIYEFMNDLQEIFDAADKWERKIHNLMVEHAGMESLLKVTSEFLQNSLSVKGLDFVSSSEAGGERLSSEIYTEHWDPVSGCRSISRNLLVDEKVTHKLILTETQTEITQGVFCVLDNLTDKLEFLLAQEEDTNPDEDMEQIFIRLLSDRTADYMQVSRQLGELGWGGNHEYMCLVLQITYLNQQNLSTKAVFRYIKKKFEDSVCFLYQNEIVVFFNLTRLEMDQEKISGKLIYFIRDTYLKAGYSRVMTGHMNLRRQYIQAKTALDVGSRKKPYLWIQDFNQVALTYILEQTTRRLPGNMICHEGLLDLKEQDEKNQTQYLETLRVYLEQHLSATQAARELFIHRSTFLYRLDRIREILQSDLDDPEEIFYLELSFRLLEQENEKE